MLLLRDPQNSVLHMQVHAISSFCNLQDWTPLHSAVSAGHPEIVQALISGGADVNAANSSGQTALHYAVSFVLLSGYGQRKQPSLLASWESVAHTCCICCSPAEHKPRKMLNGSVHYLSPALMLWSVLLIRTLTPPLGTAGQ